MSKIRIKQQQILNETLNEFLNENQDEFRNTLYEKLMQTAKFVELSRYTLTIETRQGNSWVETKELGQIVYYDGWWTMGLNACKREIYLMDKYSELDNLRKRIEYTFAIKMMEELRLKVCQNSFPDN